MLFIYPFFNPYLVANSLAALLHKIKNEVFVTKVNSNHIPTNFPYYSRLISKIAKHSTKNISNFLDMFLYIYHTMRLDIFILTVRSNKKMAIHNVRRFVESNF